MSTTFCVPPCPPAPGHQAGLPLVIAPHLLPASVHPPCRPSDAVHGVTRHATTATDGCRLPAEAWIARDTMMHSTGRCRSPVAQPLRKRQLPASFWQEPNVPPRGSPAHFAHPLHWYHRSVHWPASTALCARAGHHAEAARDGSRHYSRHKPSELLPKEFLERLQKAQVRGYGLAASRFPITDFLFYNYGLRSYLGNSTPTSTSASTESSSSSAASAGLVDYPPLPAPRAHPSFKDLDTMHCDKARSSRGVGQTVQPVVNGLSWSLPTLCPYLGYNCPNLHTGRPHRMWDCVLGQAPVSALGVGSAQKGGGGQGGGDGDGGQWKSAAAAAGDRGVTVSPAPRRPVAYSPFGMT